MQGIDPNDEDFKYLMVDRKKLMKEQVGGFDSKKNCWIPDEKDGYVAAEVQSTKGDEVTVETVLKHNVSIVL